MLEQELDKLGLDPDRCAFELCVLFDAEGINFNLEMREGRMTIDRQFSLKNQSRATIGTGFFISSKERKYYAEVLPKKAKLFIDQ